MSGSTRSESVHRRLASAVAPIFAANGVDADVIDLADYPMPIYDGDIEQRIGVPEPARLLANRLAGYGGLVLLSPEHNGGPSALLKNTIDWVTRVDRGAFQHLLIGLAAASPGPRGGTSGLGTVQRLVEHMRLDLAPVQLSIPHSGQAFAESPSGAIALARSGDIDRALEFVAGIAAALSERTATAV